MYLSGRCKFLLLAGFVFINLPNECKTQYVCDEIKEGSTTWTSFCQAGIRAMCNPVAVPTDKTRCVCIDSTHILDKERECRAYDVCKDETRTLSGKLQMPGDYCQSKGASCLALPSGFVCICPPNFYFDSTAEKCVAICLLVKCEDNRACNENSGRCEGCIRGWKSQGDKCTEIPEDEMCKDKCGNAVCKREIATDPASVKCSCPNGFQFNNKDCKSIACQDSSKCQHECVPGTYNNSTAVEPHTCKCKPGFDLQADTGRCNLKADQKAETCDPSCTTGICKKADGGKGECVCNAYIKGVSCTECTLPVTELCPKCKIENNVAKCLCDDGLEDGENGLCRKKEHCNAKEKAECDEINAECTWDKHEKKSICSCRTGDVHLPNKGNCTNKCDFYENSNKCTRMGATCQNNGDEDTSCVCDSLYLKWGLKADGTYACLFDTNVHDFNLPGIKENSVSVFHASDNKKALLAKLKPFLENIGGKDLEVVKDVNRVDVTDDGYATYIVTVSLADNVKPEAFVQTLKTTIENPGGCVKIGAADCVISSGLVIKQEIFKTVSFSKLAKPCDYEGDSFRPCSETPNSNCAADGNFYQCTCKEGYKKEFQPMGITDNQYIPVPCIDVDECSDKSHHCNETNSFCVNTLGSYICECKSSYVRNPMADPVRTLQECVYVCEKGVHLCAQGSTCRAAERGNYYCECSKGKSGIYCEEDIQIAPCEREKSGTTWSAFCNNISGTCRSIGDSPTCDCGANMKFQDDACKEIPVCNRAKSGTTWSAFCNSISGTCRSNGDSPTCDCGANHKFEGDACKVDDPCLNKGCKQGCDTVKNECTCRENFELDADKKTCICKDPKVLLDPNASEENKICKSRTAKFLSLKLNLEYMESKR